MTARPQHIFLSVSYALFGSGMIVCEINDFIIRTAIDQTGVESGLTIFRARICTQYKFLILTIDGFLRYSKPP
jgi:hypothetical protein